MDTIVPKGSTPKEARLWRSRIDAWVDRDQFHTAHRKRCNV